MDDESRPVAVLVLFQSHRSLFPRANDAYELHMAIALDTARYSSTKPGSGCNRLSRRLRSASSFVVNCAVFAPCCALLEGGGSFSVPYSASATCCGDARFTRAPSGMAAAADSSIPASLRRKSPTAARTADGSKPKPTCSI